jgi:hypothetical protein
MLARLVLSLPRVYAVKGQGRLLDDSTERVIRAEGYM